MRDHRLARLKGVLKIDDMARHITHEFQVPDGVNTLRLRLETDPQGPETGPIPHQISLSVYGPNGARGTRHNNPDQSPVISVEWASPGYMAGPIEPGIWQAEIDTHRILPPGQVDFQLEVIADAAPTRGPAAPPPQPVPDRGAGWYRGDLHGHSAHSDARWSVAEFVEYARTRGLDFATLTDHNTISGLAEARAAASEDLLVMGGVELTTFHGHALVLPARDWVDWRIKEGQTMSARAREIQKAGQLFIIAHPMSPGHPWCTGCHWAYADTYPGPARLVEIWNGPWGDEGHNELALKLFYTWLNAGLPMRATAGSDAHRALSDPSVLGANVIYAQSFTEAGLLEGLAKGHCYLSSGPRLALSAQAGGQAAMMGDRIAAQDPVDLSLSWEAAEPGDRVRLIAGHKGARGAAEIWSAAAEPSGAHQQVLASKPGGWVTAEIRAANGHMRALSNPIFMGPEPG